MEFRRRQLLSSNVAVLFFVSTLFLLISFRFQSLLPAQFFRDSYFFKLFGDSLESVEGFNRFDSYKVITDIYKVLGLFGNSFGVTIFNWIIFHFVFLVAMKDYLNAMPIHRFFAYSFSYNILILFYGQGLTKEVVSSILCLTLVLRYRFTNKLSTKIIILVLVGLTFRKYYLLIAFFVLSIYLYTNYLKTKGKRFRVFNLYLAIFTGLAIVFAIPKPVINLLNFDFIVELREARMNLLSGTLIEARSTINVDAFSNNPLSNFLQLLRAISQFLFPFHVLDVSLYAIATFVMALACTYSLLFAANLKNDYSDPQVRFIQFFLFSFFVSGVIFEPDLGSFVRHTFPYFPIIFCVFEKHFSQKT